MTPARAVAVSPADRTGALVLSGAVALSLLALGANAGQQPAPTGVTAEPADVVWRYDTGG
jgi:hypothetical protein